MNSKTESSKNSRAPDPAIHTVLLALEPVHKLAYTSSWAETGFSTLYRVLVNILVTVPLSEPVTLQKESSRLIGRLHRNFPVAFEDFLELIRQIGSVCELLTMLCSPTANKTTQPDSVYSIYLFIYYKKDNVNPLSLNFQVDRTEAVID